MSIPDAINKTKTDEERIMAEFLLRRHRERMYYLLLMGGLVAFFGLLFLGLTREWLDQQALCLLQIVFILLAGFVFWLSWRNWRCPACDAGLGGWTLQINAGISPETLKCPQCGARLL